MVDVETIHSDNSEDEQYQNRDSLDQFSLEDNASQHSEAITIEDQSMNDLERLMVVNLDQIASTPE